MVLRATPRAQSNHRGTEITGAVQLSNVDFVQWMDNARFNFYRRLNSPPGAQLSSLSRREILSGRLHFSDCSSISVLNTIVDLNIVGDEASSASAIFLRGTRCCCCCRYVASFNLRLLDFRFSIFYDIETRHR